MDLGEDVKTGAWLVVSSWNSILVDIDFCSKDWNCDISVFDSETICDWPENTKKQLD